MNDDDEIISLDDELEPLIVREAPALPRTITKPPPLPARVRARGSERAITAN